MGLIEIKEICNNYLGLRCKEEKCSILLYANSFTLIVDIYKWLIYKTKRL